MIDHMHSVRGTAYIPAKGPKIVMPEKNKWNEPIIHHKLRHRAAYTAIPRHTSWIHVFRTILAPLITIFAYDSCTIFMGVRKDTI